MENTIAYYDKELITESKSFYVTGRRIQCSSLMLRLNKAAWALCYKTFLSVIYAFSYYARVFVLGKLLGLA